MQNINSIKYKILIKSNWSFENKTSTLQIKNSFESLANTVDEGEDRISALEDQVENLELEVPT
jgi:hypothetical protein